MYLPFKRQHQIKRNEIEKLSSPSILACSCEVRFDPISGSNNAVSGTQYCAVIPKVNFSFSLRSIGPIEVREVQLFANLEPNEDLTVQMKNP